MSKAKKNTASKPRPETYEPKVAIKADFNQALNVLAQHANKVVKERKQTDKK